MKSDLKFDGFAFRLRPVSDEDAAFILELRSNPELNYYLHATPPTIENQLAWQDRYYQRPDDYYFIVECKNTGEKEGVIGIYNIDLQQRSAEWGRWILKSGSLAAIESAWLIYRVAFEIFSLDSVYCCTIVDNAQVVSFHDSCGIPRSIPRQKRIEIDGEYFPVVEHRVDQPIWSVIEPRLMKLSQLTARKVRG